MVISIMVSRTNLLYILGTSVGEGVSNYHRWYYQFILFDVIDVCWMSSGRQSISIT